MHETKTKELTKKIIETKCKQDEQKQGQRCLHSTLSIALKCTAGITEIIGLGSITK